MVSDAPRPRVVTSLVVWETPWNPATMTRSPASKDFSIRPGVMSIMRALPWAAVVITPAWEPVYERAGIPTSDRAIASRAADCRSPVVRSMSSSRGAGCGETSKARSIRSSVVSPIAEMTTTMSLPACFVAAIRRATRLIDAASATEDPPNFWTTRVINPPARFGHQSLTGDSTATPPYTGAPQSIA